MRVLQIYSLIFGFIFFFDPSVVHSLKLLRGTAMESSLMERLVGVENSTEHVVTY